MTLNKLNIVRDCWWLHASGDVCLTDENLTQSNPDHGLYNSLNTDDADYIQMQGSGDIPTYYCRLDTTNLTPTLVKVSVRAEDASSAVVGINGHTIGSFGSWGSLSTQDGYFALDATSQTAILEGRLDANYDNFSVRLINSGDPRLYNVEVFFSGDTTWTNYTSGLPNVESLTCYPNELKFRDGSQWTNQDGELVDASGSYHIDSANDSTYIKHSGYPELTEKWWLNDRSPVRFDPAPNGGLGLVFNISDIEPLTQVTRAQLTLRMALPEVGSHENLRDTFEVNGYNKRFKEQDYKHEMSSAIGTNRTKRSRYGYFVYGVGEIVESVGFQDYVIELDFVDPSDENYASTFYRNIDIFNTMDFRMVGLPSGAQVSAASLYLEYLPNTDLGLYTVGGVGLVRAYKSSFVDIGSDRSPYFGDGAWQHRGNLHEGTVFDAFYNFDELAGSATYPVSFNAASGAYGVYTNGITETPVYDEGQLVDIIYEWEPMEPTRKNIDRDPVRTEFGETYDPTHYRNMVYNQSPFIPWHVHDPEANAYNPETTNVYFDDRIVIGTDFTLYFSLYREPTNQGQVFGQFFQRSQLGSAGSIEYEVLGFLEPEKLTFVIKDTNDVSHSISVPLEAYSIEPILVWVTCKYDETTDQTTFKLNVHSKIKNYFYEDWLHDEVTFDFSRKLLNTSYTMLGPLYAPTDLDQQLAFSQFMSWLSIVEFGWADSAIELDYQTSTEEVRIGYDYSQDNDKKFLASRLCNGEYLHGRRVSDTTIGGDPINPGSSGWLLPTIALSEGGGGGSIWVHPEEIKDDINGGVATSIPPWGVVAGEPTPSLVGYGWGIEVPSGKMPVGIEVQVRAYCNPTNAVRTHSIQLGRVGWQNGNVHFTDGEDQKNTGPLDWRTTPQTFTYGGSNNTWGLGSGLTADYVENTLFGVGIRAEAPQGQYASAYVDWMKIRVYYSGESDIESIDTFKHIHWDVINGSGAAEHSTTYLIDQWRDDQHSLYNPVTTAGTYNIVHPSAIKVEIETEHNTDHPSGVDIICDIEFDSGSTDNWKVFRSKLNLGSGQYDGIADVTGFDKHIGMGGLPIEYSDASQINLTITTSYPDLDSTEYFGDLKIKSVKVYFDSYSASVTGINTLDLYTEGGIGESNNTLDLYLLAADVDSNDMDLFIQGIPYYSSGEMPLYTEGMVPTTSDMPLYINGIPFYASGDMTLFTKAITWTPMTLFIEGLDPPADSGNMPLYTWGTPVGVGGLYKNTRLFIGGSSPWHMPLYLHNEGPSGTAESGDMSLMINAASGINETVYLYTDGHETPINTMSLVAVGGSTLNDSIDMYTYGSGLPETKTTTIYTNGY